MRAGNLDRRITFQTRTISAGRANAPVETWADTYSCWAGVTDISASERAAAPKEMAQRSSVFRIRYRVGLTETMRILYDGRTWDITGIKELGRREGLEISAEATEV